MEDMSNYASSICSEFYSCITNLKLDDSIIFEISAKYLSSKQLLTLLFDEFHNVQRLRLIFTAGVSTPCRFWTLA